MDDVMWDNDSWGADDEHHGIPVPVEETFTLSYDIERFIMTLPQDEARVLIARALGFQGEYAAELAGFGSIWIYIRKLKKLQARMQSAKGVAF